MTALQHGGKTSELHYGRNPGEPKKREKNDSERGERNNWEKHTKTDGGL